MEIKILIKGVTSSQIDSIIINENDTVEDLKEKIIIKNLLKKFAHKDHNFRIKLKKPNAKVLKILKKGHLKYFNINQDDEIIIYMFHHNNGGGGIDNLKAESEKEIAKKIGFDMDLLKRDELYINLIHFDLNMTNEENYKYFNNFKVDVVGGFYAMDDINILKKLLNKISKKNISFIVVSSGSSAKEIIPICKKYSFIKEVIIFCFNYEKNKHYIDEYPLYVKKVITSIEELYNYLKDFFGKDICNICHPDLPYQFEQEEIQMDRQIQESPVITKEEYDRCYFLIHRAYSYFFRKFNSSYHSFNNDNYKIIEELLELLLIKGYLKELNDKKKLLEAFKELKNCKRADIFVEEAIRKYTGESIFCYLFNRMMRNIDSGLVYLSYFMGPFIFELNKYVKNRKECAFSKDMTLYRKFNCTETEFYLYKLNLNHIICFPGLTSTSSQDINFNPTNLAGQINNKEDDTHCEINY